MLVEQLKRSRLQVHDITHNFKRLINSHSSTTMLSLNVIENKIVVSLMIQVLDMQEEKAMMENEALRKQLEEIEKKRKIELLEYNSLDPKPVLNSGSEDEEISDTCLQLGYITTTTHPMIFQIYLSMLILMWL